MSTSNNDQFRILVLEDDLISQVSASQVIQRAAPEGILLMARSLAEGRRLLGKYEFHLCVLDIQLPDGSGIDFLYDIQVSSPHACVAILTGVPLPHYRDQAEASHNISDIIGNDDLRGTPATPARKSCNRAK